MPIPFYDYVKRMKGWAIPNVVCLDLCFNLNLRQHGRLNEGHGCCYGSLFTNLRSIGQMWPYVMKLTRLDVVVGSSLSGAQRLDEKREMGIWRKVMEVLNMVGWATNGIGRRRTLSEKRR